MKKHDIYVRLHNCDWPEAPEKEVINDYLVCRVLTDSPRGELAARCWKLLKMTERRDFTDDELESLLTSALDKLAAMREK